AGTSRNTPTIPHTSAATANGLAGSGRDSYPGPANVSSYAGSGREYGVTYTCGSTGRFRSTTPWAVSPGRGAGVVGRYAVGVPDRGVKPGVVTPRPRPAAPPDGSRPAAGSAPRGRAPPAPAGARPRTPRRPARPP